MAAGTAAAVASVMLVAGLGGFAWPVGCDPAGRPCAAEPWPWPGPPVTAWVTPLTPDATAVTADDAGDWWAGTLAGGAGTLAAGEAGTLAAGGAGVLAGGGTLAGGVLAAGPGGWLGGPGGWLWPLPWPGIRPWTALTAEAAEDVIPPTDTVAVSPLPGALPGEPEVWAAEARPATSNAKISAADNPPHAYRKTLRARTKARDRVADPSTGQQATPDADNHEYLRATEPDHACEPCPTEGYLAAWTRPAGEEKT